MKFSFLKNSVNTGVPFLTQKLASHEKHQLFSVLQQTLQ
ncbi:hypothetical protein AC564_1032c [Lacticaseibacillus paracasei]|nr:hypothetical protein Lpp17_1916 [Lacticaseibacillus paracasei subsp. paracasei Lpp17]EPC32435.1 hypothetical protein Lpp223_2147 [Lacticaseibacillus paracasei subsp. paracasei Lpp223]KTE99217.1 hypothetical protein AC564_1032c [Lacticaseibacillus paracasei]